MKAEICLTDKEVHLSGQPFDTKERKAWKIASGQHISIYFHLRIQIFIFHLHQIKLSAL